ncbi:glycosyltransferase family 2 protein [Aurantibacter sp.]|uniref:glycosyltransferase family 2 protein n=1 Tax=Aurantibacter sp. TaxID=2807103 RepID=UPI0035C7ED1D
MNIAIVILNWNGKSLLEQFLPSVVKYSKEAKVYVADNASTDNSISFIKANYPNVTILENAKNGGYAKGYNDALKQVKEPIYCLLNSDIEVTENWLKPIEEEFSNEENTAIIQPKILDYKKKSHFEYAGAAGGFVDALGYPYCRGRIFNTIEVDENQYKSDTVFWASGACLFIRKSVFNELNGFDESYFAHYEEIDLCWRAFNLGYITKYNQDSIVYHVGGATLNASNPKKTELNFRNSLFTLVKNVKGLLLLLVFIRLALDGVAGIKFLLEFKPKHTFAIIKAHFSFYIALPKLLKQRKSLQQKKGYYGLKSVVYSYFIQKKRFFNQF